MRKIVILVIIILSLGFYIVHTKANGKIDLKLNSEIGIIFISKNALLIQDENDATLLVLDNNQKIGSLSRFKYSKLNVLTLSDQNIDLKYNQKIVLNNSYEDDGVKYFKRDGVIYISYKDTNTCIYTGGTYNISDCKFIYFYNTSISNIILHDYNEIILHHYKNPLSTYILEDIYDRFVDTYQIRNDKLAIIKIGQEDYDFIVLDNE